MASPLMPSPYFTVLLTKAASVQVTSRASFRSFPASQMSAYRSLGAARVAFEHVLLPGPTACKLVLNLLSLDRLIACSHFTGLTHQCISHCLPEGAEVDMVTRLPYIVRLSSG